MNKKILLLLLSIILALVACNESGNGEKSTIIIGDGDHDSRKVHNHIAQTIIENGFGYDVEITFGSRAAVFQGIRDGEIDVDLEVWSDNIMEIYEEALEADEIITASTNFNDNEQGIYVPTYVIEGDEERGIEPIAPDLKTLEDLKKYPDLFEDPEAPGRGRLIGSPAGWKADELIREKMTTYELEETINYFNPGSDSALVTSLVKAYESGKTWAGYYWSPTIVTAKYDLTLLEEPPFDKEIWDKNKGTEFPKNEVYVTVHKDLPDKAPDVFEFLSNYETSTALTEEALIYMNEQDASPEDAAIWWMNKHEDIWSGWIPGDIVKKVKEAL